MKKFIIIACIEIIISQSNAQPCFWMQNLKYVISPQKDDTCCVSISGNAISKEESPVFLCQLTIPAEVYYNGTTYKVKEILSGAFEACQAIDAVTIEDGVEYIAANAFKDCLNLQSILLPPSILDICPPAFSGCRQLTQIRFSGRNDRFDTRENCNAIIHTPTNEMVCGCRSSTIPSSVISIGHYAFYGCIGLSALQIPEGVEHIGDHAFYGCIDLSELKLPESLTSIGGGAFGYCAISSAHIPKNVKTIRTTVLDSNPFIGCLNLTDLSVARKNPYYDSRHNCNAIIQTNTDALIAGCKETKIPSSVKSIESGAFGGMATLGSVYIPANVTRIENASFHGCTGLNVIMVDKNNSVYDSRHNCNAIIETHKSKVIAGCISTVIPDDIQEIGSFAFYDMSTPETIVIPPRIKYIGESAYERCKRIERIYLPENLRFVERCAFRECTALSLAYIGQGINMLPDRLFDNCTQLKNVYLPNNLISIGEAAFKGCPCENDVIKIYETIRSNQKSKSR